MNEQQQASELARWLAQPAGTPPPEGLDPDVVEAIYSLNPDFAPAASLTADDILADFGALGSMADPGPEAMPPSVQDMDAAPNAGNRPLLPANRIAGLGVLLATAATLLVVVLPVLEGGGPVDAVEIAAPADLASSRSAARPDPYVGGGELTEAQQKTLKTDGAVDARSAVAAQLQAGDAVADAALGEADGAGGARGDYAFEQAPRFGGEDLIPEVAAAPAEPTSAAQAGPAEGAASDVGVGNTAGQWADDAVAMLDDMDEDQQAEADIFGEASADEDVPQQAYAPPARAESVDGQNRKSQSRKNNTRDMAPSAPAVETSGGSVVDIPTTMDDVLNTAAPTVSRNSAVPSDVDSRWRNSADATTLAAIDQALQVARAEASGGNPAAAAASVSGLIHAPSDAGQYVAGLAARWYLDAGDPRAASATAQRGLALDVKNTPYRSQLLLTYGDALSALGDIGSAQSAWSQAATLNATR
jgi:hypothetical protein